MATLTGGNITLSNEQLSDVLTLSGQGAAISGTLGAGVDAID